MLVVIMVSNKCFWLVDIGYRGLRGVEQWQKGSPVTTMGFLSKGQYIHFNVLL
jgi:hypothetical protein